MRPAWWCASHGYVEARPDRPKRCDQGYRSSEECDWVQLDLSNRPHGRTQSAQQLEADVQEAIDSILRTMHEQE